MDRLRTGMLGAMGACRKYRKMPEEKRAALREERLRAIVAYARENSPYYARLYAGLGEDPKLSELPPVNKSELMEHWDDWVTDGALKLEDVREFMQNTDNIGRKFRGKYLIFTTSGSTGNPLVTVCDATTNNVMGAVNALRAFARGEDTRAFMRRGAKTIGVFATGGFYLGNSSVRSRLLKMPWKKRQMAVTSALLPLERIVSELNAFQPAMLGGYPSHLELLIDERESGRLRIDPVLIMTGGEHLSDSLRERLARAFDCYVQSSYSCTEGGTLACECGRRHYHINDDWVLIEPVDRENRPVPPGVRADKILMTNLFNFTQPYIRYEITDRVVLHDEGCGCGNPSPWLSIEGRSDDVVRFNGERGEVRLAPLAIYATLKEVHELRRFQFIALPGNRARLRIETAAEVDRRQAFNKAVSALEGFFTAHGLSGIEISLSEEAPAQDAGSGKFKHIIQQG